MDTSGIKANVTNYRCNADKPISWSSKDTDQTIKEVKEHNAAWDANCKSIGSLP